MIARLRKRNRSKVKPSSAWSGYSSDPKSLKEYMVLIGGLNALIVVTIAATLKSKRDLPGSMGTINFLVLALGTHKLARLLSKDRVTSPFRAPFVEYQGSAGAGEVEEVERGEGMRRAIGELATCPYCVTPWAATAMVLGYAVNPKATQVYSCILALTTIGYFMNLGYAKAKEKNE